MSAPIPFGGRRARAVGVGYPRLMRVIRDIDVFDDEALMRHMTACSLVTLALGLAAVFACFASGMPHEAVGVPWLLVTLVVTAISLAVHELVHGALFRVLGGPDAHVRFGAKAGMLYAGAPGIVLGRRRFLLVLLAPTFVVTVVLLVGGLVLGVPLGAAVAAVMHLSGCSGDWAFSAAIIRDPAVTMCEDTDRGIRLLGEDLPSA
ncbi:MAG: DUF3267 domain-containing protein [Atopobiaceae bacterium]|nr:DUF3267 domain-containing protein [Atopobiaceae bacterium]MCI2172808.1 DUF3267 domain-containing protein [Atopobiaceae bacterium]MCI2207115.1 DUF3267 domain-containing protein [Atopobiaceae bacterium]